MLSHVAGVCALIVVGLLAPRAALGCTEHPGTSLGPRLMRLGEPVSLALIAGAVAAPLALAPTGLDHRARLFWQRDLRGRYAPEQLSVATPYALGGAVAIAYGLSAITGDCQKSSLMNRSIQAMSFAFLTVTVLKLAVGRGYLAGDPSAPDRLSDEGRATEFLPFQQIGAWPSGHAATTFAFAAVLRTTLPKDAGILRYSGYALAGAVSVAMMYGDHHWSSDIASGAMFGEAIGRSFGRAGEAPRAQTAHASLVPAGMGLAIVGVF